MADGWDQILMTELDNAIEEAKKLSDGTYLLVVRKGSVTREVLGRVGTPTIRFIIVETHGDPNNCVALYRVEAEKPL